MRASIPTLIDSLKDTFLLRLLQEHAFMNLFRLLSKHCNLHWKNTICPRKNIHTIINVILHLDQYGSKCFPRQRALDWAPAHTALQLCSLSSLNFLFYFCYNPLSLSLITTSATHKHFFLPSVYPLPFILFSSSIEIIFVCFLLSATVYGTQQSQLPLSCLLKRLYSPLSLCYQNACQK